MKYRQPGYRDNEFKEEREKKHRDNDGPRPPRGPRGMERAGAGSPALPAALRPVECAG